MILDVDHDNGGRKPRNVKEYNNQLILAMIRGHKTVSMTEIADMTGLSKTTISKIFTRFLDSKIIMPVGRGNSTVEGGKKPILFGLNPNYCYVMLLSLGFPDYISCTLINFTGQEIAYQRVETKPDTSYEEALMLSARLIETQFDESRLSKEKIFGIAISYDGIVDTVNGVIMSSAYHSWEGRLYVCADLSDRLSFQTNVVLSNAVWFAGYAELAFPELLQGNKMVINWESDQTLGCSLFSGRNLVLNNRGIVGGFGHMLIDTTSEIVCRCGVRGCLQSLLSKEAVLDYISRTEKRFPDSEITARFWAGTFDMRDIFSLVKKDDPFARDLMGHVSSYFAILIHNVFSLHGFQKIILQGMFSLAGEAFLNELKDKIINFNNLHIFDDVDIVYSEYSSGKEDFGNPYVKGAAMYLSDLMLHSLGEI